MTQWDKTQSNTKDNQHYHTEYNQAYTIHTPHQCLNRTQADKQHTYQHLNNVSNMLIRFGKAYIVCCRGSTRWHMSRRLWRWSIRSSCSDRFGRLGLRDLGRKFAYRRCSWSGRCIYDIQQDKPDMSQPPNDSNQHHIQHTSPHPYNSNNSPWPPDIPYSLAPP